MWLENGSGRGSAHRYRDLVNAISLVLAACLLTACGRLIGGVPTGTAGAATAAITRVASTGAPSLTPPPPTDTPAPTATPEPLALTVNGQPVTLVAYEREVARCQAGKASAGFDAADCPDKV